LQTLNNKLNTLTLSGLIIGPILGSGVILLPPLLYNNIQNNSLLIWFFISVFGFAFALIFSKLAIMYKGDGGVSLATKETMGNKYQLLTSFYLIFAVLFGPVAVILTAATFLQVYFKDTNIVILAFIIYMFCYLLLTNKINFIGKIMLIVTSATTIIFAVSSINILLNITNFSLNLLPIDNNEIGYSFLLIFWAIVGWEIIGNYSNDVKNIKTLTKAVILSVIVVSCVYLLVASAITFGDFPLKNQKPFLLVWLFEPIFGNYSNIILNTSAVILCMGSLTLFVGGVARLMSSLKLSKYSSKHLKNGSPIGAINLLAISHIANLILVYFNILNISDLVAFADGFFIANAIIGLITAIILFKNGFLRYSAIVLSILFFIILLYSNIIVLFIIMTLYIFTYFKKDNYDKT
jgi:APA family basic amino acid/polyamine antiporter